MNNILNYQTKESEVLQLETQLKKSDVRRKLVKARMFLTEAENIIATTEGKAHDLHQNFLTYSNRISAIEKEIAEYESTVDTLKTEDEVNYLQKTVLKLKDSMKAVERDMETTSQEITKLLEDFHGFKEKLAKNKADYTEFKEKYDILKKEMKPQMDAVRREMKEMEKTISKEVLETYRKLREEKIFPVFVELVNGEFCGGCRMELALDKRQQLKDNNYVRCEQCGRLILAKH